MSALISPEIDRAAWLAERRRSIGASEAAAALGLSPFESPLQLYLRKIGQSPDAAETEAMRWGHRLEDDIAEEYTLRTGHGFAAYQVFLRDNDRPHLTATLDGVTGEGHAVEFKAISAWKGRDLGDDGSDEIPDHWLIQSHMQMQVAGIDRCDFAVLVGGQQLRIFTVPRRQQVLDAILPSLDDFWQRVADRNPPPPDFGRDLQAIRALFPNPQGARPLGAMARDAAERYQSASEAIREAEKARDVAKAELLLYLADTREGLLPDGRLVRRYDQDHAEQTVTRKAYSSTTLRILKARG